MAVLSTTEVVTMVETRTSAEALVLEAVLILAALVPSVDHVTEVASAEVLIAVDTSAEALTAVVASAEDQDHMVVDTSEVAATEVVVMEAMAAVDISVDVANPTATDAPRHSSFAVSGSSVCDDRQPESLYS